ncbi:MAG: hypothetical protein V3V08_08030 [Nannocystaceae bacterium]
MTPPSVAFAALPRLAFAGLFFFTLPGCDKGASASPNDPESPKVAGAGVASRVVQDPDPSELAVLRAQYVRGDYAAVDQKSQPLVARLTGPRQARAAALSLAWRAMALAESMPERAKTPAEAALAKARGLEDDEVSQLTHIAQGVYLMRLTDHAGAQAEFDRALEYGYDSPNASLATLFRAETLLNQAFGADDRLVDGSKLVAAAGAYEEVVRNSGEAIVRGRALEALAAISKENGDKAGVCGHASEAAALYDKAMAAEFLKQGPVMLAADADCE